MLKAPPPARAGRGEAWVIDGGGTVIDSSQRHAGEGRGVLIGSAVGGLGERTNGRSARRDEHALPPMGKAAPPISLPLRLPLTTPRPNAVRAAVVGGWPLAVGAVAGTGGPRRGRSEGTEPRGGGGELLPRLGQRAQGSAVRDSPRRGDVPT